MTKKSNEGTGTLFPPELKAVTSRLKGKEPELDEAVSREDKAPKGAKRKAHEQPVVLQTLRQEIIKIVRAELDAVSARQPAPNLLTIELPPVPPVKLTSRTGRKVSPQRRAKLATNCDAELARLFEEWRIKRGLALNRALDAALWHLLGKPPLSFQIDVKGKE